MRVLRDPEHEGPARSKPPELILKEIGELLAQGVREVVLVAQDSTNYGRDWGERDGLATLLRAITDTYPDLPWVRVMYAYPSHVTQAFLDVMAERPQICNYFDMPLQHTHPETLRRMRRPHRPVDELLGWIRSVVPDVTIRTTFITGFPGETEAEHRHVVNVDRDARLRAGRRLPLLGRGGHGLVRPCRTGSRKSVKMRRRHELMAAAQAASLRANQALIGTVQEVLIEGEGELDGRAVRVGRSPPGRARKSTASSSWTARARSARSSQVRVTAALDYDLVGEPVGVAATA